MLPQTFLAGFHPLAALAVGVGALASVPLLSVTSFAMTESGSAVNDSPSESGSPSDANSPLELSSPSESGSSPDANSPLELSRSAVKSSLVWFFDVIDQTQNFFAEAAESFQDLVNEAKLEQQAIAKSRYENDLRSNESQTPQGEIEIED